MLNKARYQIKKIRERHMQAAMQNNEGNPSADIFDLPPFLNEERTSDFEDFLNTAYMRHHDTLQQAQDLKAMQDVTKRLRQQLRFIIHALRCWRERHARFENSIRLRYSAYEGALCYADLRRHWAFYRHAMGEMGILR